MAALYQDSVKYALTYRNCVQSAAAVYAGPVDSHRDTCSVRNSELLRQPRAFLSAEKDI